MANATLRPLGGSVVLAIPPSFLTSLHLSAGSKVELIMDGDQITMKPARKRYTLAELLEGMEEGDTLPIDSTFESSPLAGNEEI